MHVIHDVCRQYIRKQARTYNVIEDKAWMRTIASLIPTPSRLKQGNKLHTDKCIQSKANRLLLPAISSQALAGGAAGLENVALNAWVEEGRAVFFRCHS